MGVQLNIKSSEARALAEEVAAATGWTITEVVTRALRRQRDEVRLSEAKTRDAAAQRERDFHRLIMGSGGRWKDAVRSLDHGDLLYDERGLPR